jgi:environmental stress-induced protein Ves
VEILDYIERSAWVSSPWGNGQGTRHEIARWPGGSGDYAARVSVAEIDRSGPFTPMPGYQRWLAAIPSLHRDLTLTIDGATVRLEQGGAVGFDGDAAVTAAVTEPVSVWNLIVRRDVPWSARIAAHAQPLWVRPGLVVIHAPWFHAPLTLGDRPEIVRGGATLIASVDHPTRLSVPGGNLIVVELDARLRPAATK